MKKKFTEAQIVFTLRQTESGTPVAEIIRKMEISEVTFYRWKKKYAGMGVSELRRLKQLDDENHHSWLPGWGGERIRSRVQPERSRDDHFRSRCPLHQSLSDRRSRPDCIHRLFFIGEV
jgi:hypothetical protein